MGLMSNEAASPPPASPLTVRRVSIDFDGVGFHWHPSAALSAIGNATSFGAVAFERMVCRAVKDALPLIGDAALERECRDFIAQEAMHSAAHKQHVKALIAAHPDLVDVPDRVEALCEELFGDRLLESRLGFAALLEGVLPAIGRHMIAERSALFDQADPRVSALLLWHFCEEIEHEATAAKLYRHLYPKRWRVRDVPLTLRFFARFTALMEREFDAHAPAKRRRERWRYDPEWRRIGKLVRRAAMGPWIAGTAAQPGLPEWGARYLNSVESSGDPVAAL
jgi:predicted metal-dependent hydrolase